MTPNCIVSTFCPSLPSLMITVGRRPEPDGLGKKCTGIEPKGESTCEWTTRGSKRPTARIQRDCARSKTRSSRDPSPEPSTKKSSCAAYVAARIRRLRVVTGWASPEEAARRASSSPNELKTSQ